MITSNVEGNLNKMNYVMCKFKMTTILDFYLDTMCRPDVKLARTLDPKTPMVTILLPQQSFKPQMSEMQTLCMKLSW